MAGRCNLQVSGLAGCRSACSVFDHCDRRNFVRNITVKL